MKKETFLELMGEIDAELIEKTQNKKRAAHKKFIVPAIAACLVICLAITAVIGGVSQINNTPVSLLCSAEYPDTVNRAPFLSDAEKYGGIKKFYASTLARMLSENQGENAVYAPANIYMALAMLAEITYGESRAQILSLLGADNINSLRTNARAIWNICYSNSESKSIIANSLWLNNRYSDIFKKDPLENIKDYYYASSFCGNFASEKYALEMRNWINSQTNGFLKDSVKDWSPDSDTALALISTLYFKDGWESTFNESETKDMTFYTTDGEAIRCPYLCANKAEIEGYWGDNFIAITKELKNGGNMLFILPDRGYTPEDLLCDEDFIKFMSAPTEWINKDCLTRDIRIPKFDVCSDGDIADDLRELGITNIFDANQADFSPLSNAPLFISEINHSIRIKIDEQGIEAASYSIIQAPCGGDVPSLVKFDRPFLFAVTSDSGIPLFAGVINNPMEN
jgi:serine protease inhibitor